MNERESLFIYKNQEFYALARETTVLRKELVEAYITKHYPGVECVVKVPNDNILSIEVEFPGESQKRSRALAQEAIGYLNGLTGSIKLEQGA